MKSSLIYFSILTVSFLTHPLYADDDLPADLDKAAAVPARKDGMLPVRTGQRKLLKPAKVRAIDENGISESEMESVESDPVSKMFDRKPLKGRKVASVDGSITAGANSRPPLLATPDNEEKLFDLRLSGLAGLTNITNSDATTQANRSSENLVSNVYLGLNADLRMWNYFGVEAEGYYGIAPTQNVTSGSTTIPMSLRQMGGIGVAKVQLPFWLGDMRFTPKLGGGYGYMGLNASTGSSTGSSLSSSTSSASTLAVGGPCGVVGLDFEPTNYLLFSADYAHSFAATASYTVGASTLAGTDPSFQRFRASAYYRLFPNFLLGGQFIERIMTSTYSSGTFNTPIQNETQTQFLGVIMLQL